MLESKLVSELKKWLNQQPNTLVYKIHGSIYQEKGIPDLIGCHNGFFFAVETKVGNNKLSLVQKAQINRILKAKGLAFVVNDKNVKVFKKKFTNYFGDII